MHWLHLATREIGVHRQPNKKCFVLVYSRDSSRGAILRPDQFADVDPYFIECDKWVWTLLP